MDGRTNPDLEDRDFTGQIAAALDWWRGAGVDLAFTDEPRSWLLPKQPASGDAVIAALAPVREPSTRKEEPAPTAPLPPLAPLPDDLTAFCEWWMTGPELGRLTGRVPPRGHAGPVLMIVAACPEDEDSERLLSGPEGHLLDGFLKAAGIGEEAVYRASVMPSHGPANEWETHAPLLASALIRHVALVRPTRLLCLGSSIPPLLGHSSPQRPAVWDFFNHEGLTVPMLTIRRVPASVSQPRWKSGLWQAWLDGTA